MEGGRTPLAYDDADEMIGQTPMAAMTPFSKLSGIGATSQYGGLTPGQSEWNAGSFSPSNNNMYASP